MNRYIVQPLPVTTDGVEQFIVLHRDTKKRVAGPYPDRAAADKECDNLNGKPPFSAA